MKALFFLIPLCIIQSCKTQTDTVISSENTTPEQMENKTTCPKEGTCTVKIHKNKRILLKEDTIGALYPELAEGTNIVVEYTYLKEGPAGTADGTYSETIHFEIPENTTTLNKENTSLEDVTLLYGKHCFCRGEAGYYPITDGKLTVTKSASEIVFNLNFTVGKTSQVVSQISERIKL